MPGLKLNEKTTKRITNRAMTELKKRGITSLPEEDFDEKKASASLNAAVEFGHLDNLIIKKK